MKVTKKHIITAYSAIACMGIGALCVYLPNRKGIELAKKLELAYKLDKYISDKDIPSKEIEDNNIDLINQYLAQRYDKFTYYTKNVTASQKETIEERVNYLPTALGSGFKIQINEDENAVFFKVDENSWAEQSGISTGDKLISIDGVSVAENGFETAKKLAGKDNTECDIVIEHEGSQKTIHFVRHNSEQDIINVISSEMYDDILYISISSISDFSALQLRPVLDENNFNSIIMDLRNNPGGNTNCGTDIADFFVSEGCVNEYYYNGSETVINMSDKDTDIKVPMVVLTNKNTASAAEILTGLLKQFNNATVIGTNTYGKGIFQSNALFQDGILHYTDGYFTVGDWECWQGKGIAPDIEIPMDNTLIGSDDDIQLQKAFEILQK